MKKNHDPVCYQCLPPKLMKDHKTYFGVVIHERTDAKPDEILMVNLDKLSLTKEE